jgi:hypothetical protein
MRMVNADKRLAGSEVGLTIGLLLKRLANRPAERKASASKPRQNELELTLHTPVSRSVQMIGNCSQGVTLASVAVGNPEFRNSFLPIGHSFMRFTLKGRVPSFPLEARSCEVGDKEWV